MPFPVTPGYCFSENLLINGNATQNTYGWTVTEEGTGWIAVQDPDVDGGRMFVTGKDRSKKRQRIDLKNFISDTREYPEIAFVESYKMTNSLPDVYEVGVYLLETAYQKQKDARDSHIFISENVTNREWKQFRSYFEMYGPGVRIVEIEHGGGDTEHHAGFEGVAITDSQLMVRVECRPFLTPYIVTLTRTSYFSPDCTGQVDKIELEEYEMESCQERLDGADRVVYYGHCITTEPPTIQLWFYDKNCRDCGCVPTSVQIVQSDFACILHPTKPTQSLSYSWTSDGFCTRDRNFGMPPDIPSPSASPPSASPTYSYYWVAWHLIIPDSTCWNSDPLIDAHEEIEGEHPSVTVCARDVLMMPNLCPSRTLMYSKSTQICKCCTSGNPQFRHAGFEPGWDVYSMDSIDSLYFNPNESMSAYDVRPSVFCRHSTLPRGLNPTFDTSLCEHGYQVESEHLGITEPVVHIDGCDIINVTLYMCEEPREDNSVAPAFAITIVTVGVILGLFCMVCYWSGGRFQKWVDEKLFGPRRRKQVDANTK